MDSLVNNDGLIAKHAIRLHTALLPSVNSTNQATELTTPHPWNRSCMHSLR